MDEIDSIKQAITVLEAQRPILGGAVMAVFGLSTSREDDPESADQAQASYLETIPAHRELRRLFAQLAAGTHGGPL